MIYKLHFEVFRRLIVDKMNVTYDPAEKEVSVIPHKFPAAGLGL